MHYNAGKEHALVERVQKSGLCYMHAGVVLQHYLVAMNNATLIPMLDMVQYFRKYMSRDNLYNHIWNDHGGDSAIFLERILKIRPGSGDTLTFVNQFLSSEDIDKHLREFGPALVSGFEVNRDFVASNSWQHVGSYDYEEPVGYHAMVLVGSRLEKGQRRYLLQNWWSKKPYIEVDAAYLGSSYARITFIETKQLEMGDYPSNDHAIVECSLDTSERFMPERSS